MCTRARFRCCGLQVWVVDLRRGGWWHVDRGCVFGDCSSQSFLLLDEDRALFGCRFVVAVAVAAFDGG